jgi:hypothetical protein
VKFTKAGIAALNLPEGKLDHFVWDPAMPGFGVRLRASGNDVRRTWVAQIRVHGQTRRLAVESNKPVTMAHITVQPIFDGDKRIGSRVWDENGIELEASDPRFRAAVCGVRWRDNPPLVTDEQSWPYGGPIIFVRASGPVKRDWADTPAADDDVIERARERILALKDRQ